MSSERDAAADLAEEIRAAVAQTARSSPAREPSPGQAQDVRLPLGRAHAHVTPAIPAGARLSRAKRFLLRALRFLWRDQASYNTLMLEASGALAGGLEESRTKLLETARAMEDFRREIEGSRAAREGLEGRVAQWIAAWERRLAIEDGRLAMLEAGASPAPTGAAAPDAARQLPPGVYSLFEERFRGSPEEIAEKQRTYLPFLEGIPGPVLDAGCGRGEFLTLLRERGIAASGVEINPIAVAACRQAGLEVEQGDALAAVAGKPDRSLGAVVAFQVVEHWEAATTYAFLREARRALAPGGVIVLETINTDSLGALRAFFLDPTHVRPVPAEGLRLLAEAAGFVRARIEYRAPMADSDRLEETSENDAKLNRLLFGPQDYALVAHAPGPP